MSETKTVPRISSWAAPTKADDELWASMTREEQLAALQELANHPDTTKISNKTVSDILARSRLRRQSASLKD